MPNRSRVVITDFIADDLQPERDALGDLADVVALDAPSEAELPGRVDDADAVMIYHNVTLGAGTIRRLTRCKLIVRCGVGYDNVDWAYARERGIPVANVPDYGTEEVADSAIGLTLTLARGIHRYDAKLKRDLGAWHYQAAAPLLRLRGRVFGVVGLGRIGTAAALRAKALGMDVAFTDPYKPDGIDKALGVRRVERLADLLEQSFVLSLHCPLTAETRHLIDAAALARMPRGSYLINTSRGGVVDLTAVPDAVRSGRLAGAGIDVFPHEPPPADHPLIAAWRDPADPCYDRVVLNPHAAFYCEEGLRDIRVKAARACRRALLGEPLRNVVN
ncbi:MAG TPA: C-terminal binding protein [Fimbriiglobus sp.]|nr:C-terminal binding protein [Fimbriiglobus sp.]